MWDLHQSVQEMAALCQCPRQEEPRENPGVKVGSQLGASLGWVCASSTTLGAAPDEKRQQAVLTASSA